MSLGLRDLPGTTRWTWLVFRPHGDSRTVSHAMPAELYEDVIGGLKVKYGAANAELDLEHSRVGEELYHLDLGGMVFTDSPTLEIHLPNGRLLSCYAHHSLGLLEQVDKMSKEQNWRAGIVPWVKLYGTHHLCCVPVSDLAIICESIKHTDTTRLIQEHRARLDAVIDNSPYLIRSGKARRMRTTDVH